MAYKTYLRCIILLCHYFKLSRPHATPFLRSKPKLKHLNTRCSSKRFPGLFAVDAYPFELESRVDQRNVQEIKQVLTHLPDWVVPHMVYPLKSIEAKKILGLGQYGQVHEGLLRHGNAV